MDREHATVVQVQRWAAREEPAAIDPNHHCAVVVLRCPYIQPKAIFTQFIWWVPHFRSRKLGKHRVDGVIAGGRRTPGNQFAVPSFHHFRQRKALVSRRHLRVRHSEKGTDFDIVKRLFDASNGTERRVDDSVVVVYGTGVYLRRTGQKENG